MIQNRASPENDNDNSMYKVLLSYHRQYHQRSDVYLLLIIQHALQVVGNS